MRRAFTSNQSFADAAFQAKMAGFQVDKQMQNARGQFVVFAKSMRV